MIRSMSQEHHPQISMERTIGSIKTTSDIEARRTELQGVQKRMVGSASLLDIYVPRASFGSRSRIC